MKASELLDLASRSKSHPRCRICKHPQLKALLEDVMQELMANPGTHASITVNSLHTSLQRHDPSYPYVDARSLRTHLSQCCREEWKRVEEARRTRTQ